MELLFDTVNLADIEKYSQIYPIKGVTSNPSIIKQEGKIDFFNHFRAIRNIIGPQQTLHVQVTAEDKDTIIAEAERILAEIDKDVYIKIPVTEEGLKAIRFLKARGVNITATAIYTKLQGLMALECGADYIAPYFNRMENLDIDSFDTISYFREAIDENGYAGKILAASFKNVAQVHKAFSAGAQAVTVQPEILHSAMGMSEIKKAVDAFNADFMNTMGVKSILDL